MVSTPTTRNRLNKQGTGDNTNTWGTKLNGEVFDLLDEALDGVVALTVSGPVTLTSTNYVSDQARKRIIKTAGTGGLITIPSVEKLYVVYNGCSGPVTIAPMGGVVATIAANEMQVVFSDGVDCFCIPALSKAGGVMTGALTLSGPPASNLHAVTKAYADGLAFSAVDLPGQAGSAGKFLTTDGTNASWGDAQPLDADLSAISLLTTQAYGRSGLTWNEVTTSGNVNPCVARTRYLIDSGTASRTLTLPAAPDDGDEIIFIDKDGNSSVNNATISRNGNKIASFASDMIVDQNYCGIRLRYRTSTSDWELFSL